MTLDELIEALQEARKRNSNAKITINIYDSHNIYGNFATSVYCDKKGTVYIVGGSIQEDKQ